MIIVRLSWSQAVDVVSEVTMIWKLDLETGRYFQAPGKNEWTTLDQCYMQHGYVSPFSVQYKQDNGVVRRLTFVECIRVSWGYEYVLNIRDAEIMNTPYFLNRARLPSFKLIPLVDYDNTMCQCDWRQVILVTGCRCGRKDYL